MGKGARVGVGVNVSKGNVVYMILTIFTNYIISN